MVQVLVTGGAGFIGSHLVDRLVADGYKVIVLDNLSTGRLHNIQKLIDSDQVKFIEGDIRNAELVKASVQNVNAVFHLAAQISVPLSIENPGLTMDINVLGTLNLLRSCMSEHVEKFIFASSCAVYGEAKNLPINELTETNPISPYAESKLLGERYCLGFCERQLIKTVVLRFFNVYGPRQCMNDYSGVITKFLDSAKLNRNLVIYGNGSQTRDFVNVKDVVQALMQALEKERAIGSVFNIGSGKCFSVKALADEVFGLSKPNSVVNYAKSRIGDIQDSCADISKAKCMLGYQPTVTLSVGLQTLLEQTRVAI